MRTRLRLGGEAEIGFQQIGELKPMPGIEIIGPLPPGAQRVTVFTAGIVAGAKEPAAAQELIDFLMSPRNTAAIRRSGLVPAGAN